MREAETSHSASSREAEVTHATAVREAEAASVVQTSKLQQAHLEAMALEDEAIEGEKHSHQSFLQACGVALQACPNEATLQLTISSRDPIPSPSHPGGPLLLHILLEISNKHLPRCEVELDHSWDGKPTSYPGEPHQWRQREEDPLVECLGGNPLGSLLQGLRPSQMHKVDLC